MGVFSTPISKESSPAFAHPPASKKGGVKSFFNQRAEDVMFDLQVGGKQLPVFFDHCQVRVSEYVLQSQDVAPSITQNLAKV